MNNYNVLSRPDIHRALGDLNGAFGSGKRVFYSDIIKHVGSYNHSVHSHHQHYHQSVRLFSLRERAEHTYEGKNHKEHSDEGAKSHKGSVYLRRCVRYIGKIQRIHEKGHDERGYRYHLGALFKKYNQAASPLLQPGAKFY